MVPSSASHFSFVTPVLPAASSSSSSSSLVPKAASSSPPTFIAPIAPSPAAAQSLISRTTPSPPSNAPMVTHNPPVATEAQASTTTSNLQTPSHRDVSEPQEASTNQLPQNPVCEQVPVQDLRTVQTKAPPSVPNNQTTSQIQPTHSPPPPPPPPASITPSPVYPSSLPQNEPSVPAAFSNQDPPPPPASQPQTEHLKSETHPDTAPPPAPQPAPHYLPHAIPLQQQLAHFYRDPLYPGFPQGDTGQVAPTPPMSTSQSGDDLPRDTNILRFFFNLGVKAYSLPMHAPVMYLYPLQQTHTLHPRASPSPETPLPVL
ncbi:hypothetical protein NQD34_013357 [Periophthalmus magnuspinnatus]|nr:hypothetical protein NQD34_013357 [Periophthalmus magnuspinnatus]